MLLQDYMKLSKKRLAELLVERDMHDYIGSVGTFNPGEIKPCWAEGGYCSNPYHDCINCPRKGGGWGITTSDNTAGFKPNR